MNIRKYGDINIKMIRGCIFDLGGTIVDRHSKTSFLSLKRAFNKKNVTVPDRAILKDMGITYYDHISRICSDNYVKNNWFREYGKFPSQSDVDVIYESFKVDHNARSMDINILPETQDCFRYLKERDIKIGVTTVSDKENMNIILSKMKLEGLYVDGAVTSCLLRPRPHPDVMNKLREKFKIKHNYQMVKFSDTPAGIQEAINGGFWSVGVVKWSSQMEIVEPEDIMGVGLMTTHEYNNRLKYVRNMLTNSRPDFVIHDLSEINDVFRLINVSGLMRDHYKENKH